MLYRWPKGRVIRTVAFVVVALIGFDLAYGGAWAQWSASQSLAESPGESGGTGLRQMIYAGIFAALAAVVFFGGGFAIGFHKKSAQFLIEVEEEMTRVTWPSRTDVVRSTIMIAILSVFLALLIFGVDFLNSQLLALVNSIGGG